MKPIFFSFILVFSSLMPAFGGYPVIDSPDLAMDLQRMAEAMRNTRREIEKYQVMTEQLAHYYFQAKKIIDGDVDIEEFLIRGFEFYFQRDIVDALFSFVDPKLDSFIQLYDGVHDLKYSINRLKREFDDLFEGPKPVRTWSAPHFRLGPLLLERGERSEAAIEHIRGAIGQSLGWVGETKHAHPKDKDTYGLAHQIWKNFQENPDDTRGRQLGYDLINGDLAVLKEVLQKRIRVLQSYQTTESLKQAKGLNAQDKRLKTFNESLIQLTETIDNWEPIQDNIIQ